MNAINYLKLDLRNEGKQKMLFLLYPFFLLMFFRKSSMISWMSLFTMSSFANMPFTAQDQKIINNFSFSLPSSISSVVCGRFLYLLTSILYTSGITYGGFFLFKTSVSTNSLSQYAYLFGVTIILMMASIQYYIFYRFTNINRNIVTLITLAPSMIVPIAISYLCSGKDMFLVFATQLMTHPTQILICSALLACLCLIASYFACVSCCKHSDL